MNFCKDCAHFLEGRCMAGLDRTDYLDPVSGKVNFPAINSPMYCDFKREEVGKVCPDFEARNPGPPPDKIPSNPPGYATALPYVIFGILVLIACTLTFARNFGFIK